MDSAADAGLLDDLDKDVIASIVNYAPLGTDFGTTGHVIAPPIQLSFDGGGGSIGFSLLGALGLLAARRRRPR
jgi:hypothetical protein